MMMMMTEPKCAQLWEKTQWQTNPVLSHMPTHYITKERVFCECTQRKCTSDLSVGVKFANQCFFSTKVHNRGCAMQNKCFSKSFVSFCTVCKGLPLCIQCQLMGLLQLTNHNNQLIQQRDKVPLHFFFMLMDEQFIFSKKKIQTEQTKRKLHEDILQSMSPH